MGEIFSKSRLEAQNQGRINQPFCVGHSIVLRDAVLCDCVSPQLWNYYDRKKLNRLAVPTTEQLSHPKHNINGRFFSRLHSDPYHYRLLQLLLKFPAQVRKTQQQFLEKLHLPSCQRADNSSFWLD